MLERMTVLPAIAVLADRDMLQRLQRAVPGMAFSVQRDWLDLASSDLEASPAAFIVDPTLLDIEHGIETLRLLGKRRGAPVILYARMRPSLAEMLLAAGQIGIRHVMLYGLNDKPDGVRETIRAAMSSTLTGASPVPPSGSA